MSELFLSVVNRSISASWIVLVVLFLRLLLKKAPKWIPVLLWGIVAVRLICPISIESALSLIPSVETISPEIMMEQTPTINTGIPIINDAVNPVMKESFAPDLGASINPLQVVIPISSFIWVVGISVMLAYTVVSYFRVKSKIGTAVLLRDHIFQSERVVSPFVFGFLKPKIYLPFNLNVRDLEHVIAHEKAHISRKDYLWKPFGFLVLALHWFNPLMWIAYVFLCRDIELACDEKVIRHLDTQQKADYSQALLTCSVNRHMITACPLAFGEVGVKDRVKSILSYKKPALWIIVIAIISSVCVGACFLTNPSEAGQADFVLGVSYNKKENAHMIYKQFMEGKKAALDQAGFAKAFEDYVSEREYKYAYLDMTGDGIPELCVDTIPEMYFFTIENGQLKHWYTEASVYGKLLNNGAILIERHGGAPEHVNYEYYELDQNAQKRLSIAFSWYEETTAYGKVYAEIYDINGKEVTKEEYEKIANQYLTVGTDNISWTDKK